MKSSSHRFLWAALAATAAFVALPTARAGHVYAGVIDTNGTPGLQAGDALSFVVNSGVNIGNPVTSVAAQNFTLAATGNFAGLYANSGITFTALSNGLAISNAATNTYFAPHAFAAASGSLLQVRVANVSGPVGANFSFWEETSLTPAFTFTVGTGITAGTGFFNLTDLTLAVGSGVNGTPPTGTNNPAVDPYGHIHGRTLTTDQPGTYSISYVVHDASGTFADSAPFVVSYTTVVPEPTTLALVGLALAGAAAWRVRRK